MDVLFLPDYTDANPYQRELGSALREQGVAVSLADGDGPLPIIAAARRAGWPDVVHLHWLHPYLIGRWRAVTAVKGIRLLVELLVLRVLGVGVVWTAHNHLEHERRAPGIERVVKHAVVRLSRAVFVHCQGAVEVVLETYRLPDRYHTRIGVVPHGNYRESYRRDGTAEGVDPGSLGDGVTFLYFGQIRPYKNVPELVAAYRELDAPGSDLLVVGNPASEDVAARVRAATGDREDVHLLLSFVPERDVTAYFELADVAVLPFDSILTSGTAVLAMGEGLPVVTPARGCPGELLAAAGPVSAALGYDPARAGALVDALFRSTVCDRNAVGRRNAALVAGHEWRHVARRTRRGYEGDLAASGTPADEAGASA